MASTPQKTDLKGYPTLEWEDQDVKGWMEKHLNPRSRFRRWIMINAAQNLWMYLGRQWLAPIPDLRHNQNFVYAFRDVYRQSFAAYPRPVTNLIAPAVDNEVARLGRRELVPDTSPRKNEPKLEAASRAAKNIMLWELAQQAWPDIREQVNFELVMSGTAILRSMWDETTTELVPVASPDAVVCPSCSKVFASDVIPAAFAALGMPGLGDDGGPMPMMHTESLEKPEEDRGFAEVRMRNCPFCEQPSELKSYKMSKEEAQGEEDPFGRQLGTMLPKGRALLEAVTVHDLYPENGGVNVDPWTCSMWGQSTVRPIDWVEDRFPELKGKIDPDPVADLRKQHPLLGDPLFSGAAVMSISGLDGIYDYHVMVKEVHIDPKPVPGLENGASIVRVGEHVCRRPLCVEVETEDGPRKVKRVKYGAARYRRMPKVFWGRSFVSDLTHVNRRLNQLDSQVIDIRERGIPTLYVPVGTEIYKRDDDGGAMRVVEYNATNPTWHPSQAMFNPQPLTGNAYYTERNAILQDAQTVGAPQDIELGKAPPGLKTTSGLMVLGEEAGASRAPRERQLIEMYEALWQHFLELQWVFRKDDISYRALNVQGRRETVAFSDTNLLGGIEVKVEKRADYDSKIYQKEATAEALGANLYRLDSQAAIDKVLELMGLPKDINEESSLQVDRAEDAWQRFLKTSEVPVLDSGLNDPFIWFQVLGKRWFSDSAIELQRSVGWPEVTRALAGWEDVLQRMELEDDKLRPIYGNVPHEQWAAVYEQGAALTAQVAETMAAAAQSMGQPPPQAQEFPKPPQRPFLPKLLQDKIHAVWVSMLSKELEALGRIKPMDGLKPELLAEHARATRLDSLLSMRAVIEAARMTDLQRKQAMAPSAPAQAAPGQAGVA